MRIIYWSSTVVRFVSRLHPLIRAVKDISGYVLVLLKKKDKWKRVFAVFHLSRLIMITCLFLGRISLFSFKGDREVTFFFLFSWSNLKHPVSGVGLILRSNSKGRQAGFFLMPGSHMRWNCLSHRFHLGYCSNKWEDTPLGTTDDWNGL